MTMTIQQVLKTSAVDFSVRPLLAEILLSHRLNVSRSYLYAHPEHILTAEEAADFIAFIKRHADGEPIEYITGHREFWSLDLNVTRDTLVPRQETELLVESALAFDLGPTTNGPVTIADLGTGTGAIALAIASVRPHWTIYATDCSKAALQVAQTNAKALRLNVHFCEGNWCQALPAVLFDLIISNPPYVAENDPHLLNLTYEPEEALVSGEDGLAAIRQIATTAVSYLKPKGWLLLEHGHRQAEKVGRLLMDAGFTKIMTKNDLSGLQRVTIGQWDA